MAIEDVADRAEAYGFDGVAINGNDVLAVYQATQGAHRAGAGRRRARRSSSARRTAGTGTRSTTRRSTAPTKSWRCGRAAIRFRRSRRTCRHRQRADRRDAARDRQRVVKDDRRGRGVRGEQPGPGSERRGDGHVRLTSSQQPESEARSQDADQTATCHEPVDRRNCMAREIAYLDAIREALREEMRRDPKVFVLGEDVGRVRRRVRRSRRACTRSSASTAASTRRSPSRASSASASARRCAAIRPVAEMQFGDFITCGFDQIVNQAATLRYRYGGRAACPIVVRAPVGGNVGGRPLSLAEPRVVVRAPARPEGGGAVHGVGREGPAQGRDPRRQPGHLPRAQVSLPPREGPGARGRRDRADRRGRRAARRRRHHARDLRRDGACRRSRRPSGCRRRASRSR